MSKLYAGLDVSLELTSICVIDAEGRIAAEAKVLSDPAAISAALLTLEGAFERVGLEAGQLSQWLYFGLKDAGLPVCCIETRHAKAAISAMSHNKTDRNDARSIAQIARSGWFKAEPANRHVRLYRWELDSAGYRSLSLYARCLLVELKSLYNGSNNGELFLSVRGAAARLNTGTHQATAAFRQLKDRGFIKTRQCGSFQWKQRHATSWLLTEYDDDMTGLKATKEFMKWRPDGAPKNKSRSAERLQSVAGAATDDDEPAQSVAGAATDSPGLIDDPVAGAATQIVYQGGDPEEQAIQTANGDFATTSSCAAPNLVGTPRGPRDIAGDPARTPACSGAT